MTSVWCKVTIMRKVRNWSSGPWTRFETNWRGEYVEIPGAQIRDRDTGVVYRATIGTGRGGPWLTSLTIETTEPGQRINSAMLSRVPTKALAEAVGQHLREVAEAGYDGVFRTRVRLRGDKPDLRELAEEYLNHKRQDLAALYGVSTSTIDRWVAEARALGLIGPAKTGRPPNPPQTPGSQPAAGDTDKRK